ncbi:MAG: OmpA family protein [Alphaproteobacteria bacterium]|nr:OmpA family protein [Alphaproteobacteria bacterium]
MKKLMMCGVALAVLSGCASNYDIAGVAAMADKGDAFAQALHKRYTERAEFERGEGNWASVNFFNTRAKMAAMGQAVALQAPSERGRKEDQDATAAAYSELSAALNSNAPQMTPDACARAQTWFEHWMEQSAEGHQADDIAEARAGYEAAIPECKPGMAAAAPMPEPFIVYFDFDSFEVNAKAMEIISMAAAAANNAGASVVLIGHADTMGDGDYNMGLSRARVNAVGNAIQEAGVDRMKVKKSHAGETSPQLDKGDQVNERMNRRVEIVFER